MLIKIPKGIAEIRATFGDPDAADFEAKNIVPFELPYPLLYDGNPVKRARCHRLAVDHFIKAFSQIEAAGLTEEVKNYSGIYARRPIRGKRNPSTHSWGIAIDLEAGKYQLGSSARFPDAVVEIFRESGFFYGGDFKNRKDGMHFQLCTGY